MRLALAWLTIFAPLASACFDGSDALGLPCTKDSQCGDGQSCSDAGTCVSKGDEGDDDSGDDGTDTVTEPCVPPPKPSYCEAGLELPPLGIGVTEISQAEFGRGIAVVAGDFAGADGYVDLALLRFDTYQLHMVANDGDSGWTIAGSWSDPNVPDAYDVVDSDVDCDDASDFVVLSNAGRVTVASWNDAASSFSTTGGITMEPNLFSLASADLVDDDLDLPDLVVSGNTGVYLVPNYYGMFDEGGVARVGAGTEFAEPWDTVLMGEGIADTRILVPESDDTSFMAQADERVHVLQVTATGGGAPLIQKAEPPALGDNFRNPWAVAVGNLDGDAAGVQEIVVAERYLDGPNEVSTQLGNLRILRLSAEGMITEVGGSEIGVGVGSLSIADLNCDGRDDVVIGTGGQWALDDGVPQVFFGAPDLMDETSLVDVPIEPGLTPGSHMAVGDFDGDGRPEVAIPDFGSENGPGERIVIIRAEAQ